MDKSADEEFVDDCEELWREVASALGSEDDQKLDKTDTTADEDIDDKERTDAFLPLLGLNLLDSSPAYRITSEPQRQTKVLKAVSPAELLLPSYMRRIRRAALLLVVSLATLAAMLCVGFFSGSQLLFQRSAISAQYLPPTLNMLEAVVVVEEILSMSTGHELDSKVYWDPRDLSKPEIEAVPALLTSADPTAASTSEPTDGTSQNQQVSQTSLEIVANTTEDTEGSALSVVNSSCSDGVSAATDAAGKASAEGDVDVRNITIAESFVAPETLWLLACSSLGILIACAVAVPFLCTQRNPTSPDETPFLPAVAPKVAVEGLSHELQSKPEVGLDSSQEVSRPTTSRARSKLHLHLQPPDSSCSSISTIPTADGVTISCSSAVSSPMSVRSQQSIFSMYSTASAVASTSTSRYELRSARKKARGATYVPGYP
jgi:hypothetical protein